MLDRLEADHARFWDIIRQKVRADLKKFISSESFGAQPGGEGKPVKVRVEGIEIPKIVYGEEQEGVGQGEGEVGDVIEEVPSAPAEGGGGTGAGDHFLEVELPYEELMEMIAQDLELPRLEPKGKKTITIPFGAYTGVRPVGPESLRIFKRSHKRALKRTIASGNYDPLDPKIILFPEDKRYRAQENDTRPYANAAVFLLRDISGSMGEDFNKVVRVVSRLFDYWIHQHYSGQVDVRYFMHDTELKPEVSRDEFYQSTSGGGTAFAPAYKGITQIIEQDHPAALWNNYCLHFTDGDPFLEDRKPAREALKELIPKTNLTAYFEVGAMDINLGWFGVVHTRKRDDLFGNTVKDLVKEHEPLFKISCVVGPDEAYDKFREVLV